MENEPQAALLSLQVDTRHKQRSMMVLLVLARAKRGKEEGSELRTEYLS